MDDERYFVLLGLSNQKIDINSHEGRWDMVDGIYRAFWRSPKHIFNLFFAGHITAEHMNTDFSRRLVKKLERVLGDAIFGREDSQDLLDLGLYLFQHLKALA